MRSAACKTFWAAAERGLQNRLFALNAGKEFCVFCVFCGLHGKKKEVVPVEKEPPPEGREGLEVVVKPLVLFGQGVPGGVEVLEGGRGLERLVLDMRELTAAA